jgi:hypothetical protein
MDSLAYEWTEVGRMDLQEWGKDFENGLACEWSEGKRRNLQGWEIDF